MKKIIVVIFSSSTLSLYSFEINTYKKQQNYWPVIKGKWYFSHEEPKEFITVLTRKGNPASEIYFISKDSCWFKKITSTDVYKYKRYGWISSNDTITFFSNDDTLTIKILNLSNEKLRFKPIYPL